MPTYDTSDRYGLRALTGANVGSDIDAGFDALRDDVSATFAGYSEGPIGSRPTSTPGTPGIAGRRYRATDTSQTFEDTGTSWIEIAAVPSTVTALPTTGNFDGRGVYLQTSAMAAIGIRWLLRYRAASSKWEFGGGAAWSAFAEGPEARGPAANNVDPILVNDPPLDRAGQQISTPAAGHYLIRAELSAVQTGGTLGPVRVAATNVAAGVAQVRSAYIGPLNNTNERLIIAEGESGDLTSGLAVRLGFVFGNTSLLATLSFKRLSVLPVLLHT